MNMLSNMFGGLISNEQKEEAIRATIQDSLEDCAEEIGCSFEDIFFVIKPKNDDFDFDVVIYKMGKDGPEMVRMIPLIEIIE